MTAKFCDLCGQPLNSGSKFCSNCGAPVHTPDDAPAPQPVQHLPTEFLVQKYFAGGITMEDAFAQCSNQEELKRMISDYVPRPSGESILSIKCKGFFLDSSVVYFGIALDDSVAASGRDFSKSFEHTLKCAPGKHMLRLFHPLVNQSIPYPIPIWKTSKDLIVAHQWEIPVMAGHNHAELKADRLMGGMLLTINGCKAVKGYRVTVPATTPLTREYWDEKS